MGRNSSSDVVVNFLYLVLLACFPSFSSAQAPPLLSGICSMVQCGMGTCTASNSLPFFDCTCNTGWLKPQDLPIPVPFPFCVVPNCTMDLQCGGTAPPPPPPPPTPIALPNFTDPCFLVWCNEGHCVPDEAGHNHSCKCNDGSDNALGQKGLPCFKQCSVNGNCEGVFLGRPLPPPPPPPNSAPPRPRKGSGSGKPSASRIYSTFSLAGASAAAIALILL